MGTALYAAMLSIAASFCIYWAIGLNEQWKRSLSASKLLLRFKRRRNLTIAQHTALALTPNISNIPRKVGAKQA